MKFKFIGESDKDFDHGEIYELVTINKDGNYIYTIFVNKNNELIELYYKYIQNFNNNWSKK